MADINISIDERRGYLVDAVRCIGCRACQVACKQWNQKEAEDTTFFGGFKEGTVYKNPPDLSAKTYTVITFNEALNENGELKRMVMAKMACLHCMDAACVSACPVGALHYSAEGEVNYYKDACIGCRYCMIACPFSVPMFEWEKALPFIEKCTLCIDRIDKTLSNDDTIDYMESRSDTRDMRTPACVKSCPTGSLVYGTRRELLEEAKRRFEQNPGLYYVDPKFGYLFGGDPEAELGGENPVEGNTKAAVGGTAIMYMSDIPFGEIGLNDKVDTRSMPQRTSTQMSLVLPIGGAMAGLCTIIYLITRRKNKVSDSKS